MKLHQALFGYDGGHQLLAASVHLPTDSKHLLAVATDSSGTPPKNGFEQVYTGLPLSGTNFYALFSTWLAPEMPRPGCVWSHVILIELPDLAQIIELGELRRLFRRPAGSDLEFWREPINFQPGSITLNPLVAIDKLKCKEVICGLYSTPHKSIVVDSYSEESCGELVFSIWAQQWPRLRRMFRFSTGSFSDRSRTGSIFDLQVIPSETQNIWRGKNIINTQQSPGLIPQLGLLEEQQWLDLTVEDLLNPKGDEFRIFLRVHGTDVKEPRAAFSRLAICYILLRSAASDFKKLRSVGALFPDPTEAIEIKKSLIALHQDSKLDDGVTHAWEVIQFLFGNDLSSAYPESLFDLPKLANLLWLKKQTEVIDLLGTLVGREENSAASSFVIAISEVLKPSDLKLIADRHSQLIPIMVAQRPSLAYEVDIWNLPGHVQSQVYEVLNRINLDPEQWARIVGGMLISGTNISVRESVANAGSFVMHGVFRWLDNQISGKFLPSQPWREALSGRATVYLKDNKNLSPPEFALAAWLIPVEAVPQILFADRDDVQSLALLPLDVLPLPLRVPTAFLLIALGLKAHPSLGGRLIARTFFKVHEALASEQYPEESWLLLTPLLPYLGWWNDWDRCKKLRRAVRKYLNNQACTENFLIDSAATPEHLELALRVSRRA